MDSAPVVALPSVNYLPTLPSGDLFLLLFYFTVAAYIIFTGVLFYHWNAYASDRKMATATYVGYLIMTIPMLLTLATTVLMIQ